MYHHFRHTNMPDIDKLWVVAVISNPARYRSRYHLMEIFKKSVERAGANLFIVECALGDRPFEVTDADNPHHLQLRTTDEIWHKENMINLGIQRLPRDWKYVAWIDADIEFIRPDWVEEIVHQLQHYKIIQVFQTAIDLGPDGQALKAHESFMSSFINHKPFPNKKNYPVWHPGYGWAARREAIDDLGGLFDVAILGSADHHMAWSLIGKGLQYAPSKMSPAYKKELSIWQDRATTHIKQNVGYMPGTIVHHWHGSKKNRRYVERWDILLKWNYDPDQDLQKDWQGLYRLSDVGERMRNDLREYFHMRNEDSIDL